MMIEVNELTKEFGPVRALQGVSFTIPRGQVVGLLGPNGAGKTTAMRILTGYLAPTAGSARVEGLDVVEDSLACRRRIGYLPEGNPLYLDFRVQEALRFAARLHGLRGPALTQAVRESIEAVGLVEMGRRLVGTLSKGYRQRVGLAQALLHKPDVLILDEPTSGLDPNQQEDMRHLIRQLGEEHTVMLSTHILPEVEAVCDRAIIISEGQRVADGTIEEIKREAAGRSTVLVTVRATAEQARAALERDGVARDVEVTDVPGEAGVLRVRIGLDGAIDRARLEEIGKAVYDAGLPLSGLEAETVSLEQVFSTLTQGSFGASTSTTPVEEEV